MTPAPRAAIYDRVSTDRQEWETQSRILRERCARQGWKVVVEYSEKVSSSKDIEDQNEFNRMMKAARSRKWDVLVFWSWDRITRRGSGAALDIMRSLDRAGVAYVSHTEPEASSQTDPALREFMVSFRAWIARLEAQRHSERMVAWHNRKRALGQPHGRGRAKDKRPRVRRWGKRPVTLDPPPTDVQTEDSDIGPIVAEEGEA